MANNPYIETEKEIMDSLAQAWNKLMELRPTHPDHTRDFADGIHKCQDVIINRIVQRDYPHVFPTHPKTNHGFKIGELVWYHGGICTVCEPENDETKDRLWVHNHSKNMKHWVDDKNVTRYGFI